MDKFAVVIPAAGQGKRMESDRNKQFILLRNQPVIVHTLKAFQASEIISAIVLVCALGEEEYYQTEIFPGLQITKPTIVTVGGPERQDSVYKGLLNVPVDCDFVMIHDGARPFISIELINLVAEAVKINGAVALGIPVKDTIKLTDDKGYITDTLNRDRLWSIQTPQAFSIDLIKTAHLQAAASRYYGTDDASLVERMGVLVRVILGSYDNIKITTPEDIIVAEGILARRLGH